MFAWIMGMHFLIQQRRPAKLFSVSETQWQWVPQINCALWKSLFFGHFYVFSLSILQTALEELTIFHLLIKICKIMNDNHRMA